MQTLTRTIIIFAILALTILPAILTGQVKAETVTVGVGQNSVTVYMNIQFKENLTALPVIDAHIDLTNSTVSAKSFVQSINEAIQRRVIGTGLSGLQVHIKTTNATGMWSMEEDYTMVVTGATANSGSNIRTNLGFVPFNVTEPFQIGTVELNSVGPALLLPALAAKAAANPNLQYYIDGSQTRNAVIPEQTTRIFQILDFTWVPLISTWARSVDLLGQSSTWTFDPASPRYNLTLGIPSPEGPVIASYVALYSPSFRVTVPASAWTEGNVVSFDIPTATEDVMPAIIVASLVVALVALIFDRRLSKPLRSKRKR